MTTSNPGDTIPLTRCQLCDEGPLQQFVTCEQVVMWHCPSCGLYQNGTLYTPNEYDGVYDHIYGPRRRKKVFTASMRLNRVAAVVDIARPRMLEVGCSIGTTLEAARNRGWDATGVDVSAEAVQLCRDRGLAGIATDGNELPFDDASFDVLTSWHVIEHVADVRQTLADWRRVLRPGGVMVLETPDASSPKVRRRGTRYAKFWKPEHTYTFDPRNLGRFVAQAGFEVLDQPLIGRLTDLTVAEACYTVAHRALDAVQFGTGNYKAFQVFARRVETAAGAVRLRRAA